MRRSDRRRAASSPQVNVREPRIGEGMSARAHTFLTRARSGYAALSQFSRGSRCLI
jgi:hypothetical protein